MFTNSKLLCEKVSRKVSRMLNVLLQRGFVRQSGKMTLLSCQTQQREKARGESFFLWMKAEDVLRWNFWLGYLIINFVNLDFIWRWIEVCWVSAHAYKFKKSRGCFSTTWCFGHTGWFLKLLHQVVVVCTLDDLSTTKGNTLQDLSLCGIPEESFCSPNLGFFSLTFLGGRADLFCVLISIKRSSKEKK